jgi:peptidoglycan/LPS O-acetylase OafA/YrhL
MESGRSRRRRNWGVLTLASLGLAVAAVFVSSGQGKYTGLTFAMLVLGLLGAATFTVRGIQQGRSRRRPAKRRD